MDLGLEGKVVIITGAAGLIGSALSHGLARQQVRLVLIDTNFQKLQELEQEIIEKLPQTSIESHWDLNLLDRRHIQDLVKVTTSSGRQIHGLVNCHYPRSKDWGNKLESVELDSWRENVDQHLNSYFLLCKEIGESMVANKTGSIVNFSSILWSLRPRLFNLSGFPRHDQSCRILSY